MGTEPELRRARAFCRELALACATRTEDVPGGVAVFHDRLPRVWDLNVVWLDILPESADAQRVAAEAERVQGALAHRKIIVTDETAGERLSAGFAALGWSVETWVLMAAAGPPDRPAPPHSVVEVDEPGQRRFREEWLRSPTRHSDDVVAQLLEQKRVVAAAVDARFFLGLADGQEACVCELYVRDGVAQIENVGTLEAFRGRGLARAVVLRAVEEARAAGCDLVFLEADGDDWPKELYRRLGFRPLGRVFPFSRGAATG
jgi:ribosomal protein S18 acetylase RimI-like enzyme